MDSTASQTSADRSHTCICSNLFELVEKLRTELQKKDEELEEKNRKYMQLSINMDSAMAQANQAQAEYREINVALKNDLFNLVEKLRIELHKKDEELQKKDQELAKEKQEKQELSAHLNVAISRASQVHEFAYGLVDAHQTIHVLQLSLRKSFPSPDLTYYIKTKAGSQNGQFRYATLDKEHSNTSRSEFKFTKNSNGSISISTCSMWSSEKYLQINTRSSSVEFTGNKRNAGKFVLFFHQQNQHAGLLVDISTLAGYFLCFDKDNNLVANSQTPPADKFLIIPVGVE